jgi:hypothetical protein
LTDQSKADFLAHNARERSMKRTRTHLIALSLASALAATGVIAQYENLRIEEADSAPAALPPAAAPNEQQQFVQVCSLNTAQANQQFQRNVQIMQAQRQQAVQLQNQINTATAEDQKQQLNAVMAKLNENNQLMVKTYGFSLTRNYTRVVETAHVYMYVSPEEAARYQAAQEQGTQSQPQ